MAAGEEAVVLRRLPAGDRFNGILHGVEGDRLRLTVGRRQFAESGSQSTDPSLPSGSLVEITGPTRLYLGEVISQGEPSLVVRIEHSLDRASLALLRQNWKIPEE